MSASGTAALPDCRHTSKAASQAAWLARPPNNDYFSGPVHVARVQAWRAAHPGYSRGSAQPSRALHDLLTPQVPDAIEKCANRVEPVEAGDEEGGEQGDHEAVDKVGH